MQIQWWKQAAQFSTYERNIITVVIVLNINDESPSNDWHWLTHHSSCSATCPLLSAHEADLLHLFLFSTDESSDVICSSHVSAEQSKRRHRLFSKQNIRNFKICFTEFHVRIPSHHHNRTSRPAVHIWVIAVPASEREWRMFRRRADDDDDRHHHGGWDLSLPCHHQPPCDSLTHTHTHMSGHTYTHI